MKLFGTNGIPFQIYQAGASQLATSPYYGLMWVAEKGSITLIMKL
jgi:hypothetical protein